MWNEGTHDGVVWYRAKGRYFDAWSGGHQDFDVQFCNGIECNSKDAVASGANAHHRAECDIDKREVALLGPVARGRRTTGASVDPERWIAGPVTGVAVKAEWECRENRLGPEPGTAIWRDSGLGA